MISYTKAQIRTLDITYLLIAVVEELLPVWNVLAAVAGFLCKTRQGAQTLVGNITYQVIRILTCYADKGCLYEAIAKQLPRKCLTYDIVYV